MAESLLSSTSCQVLRNRTLQSCLTFTCFAGAQDVSEPRPSTLNCFRPPAGNIKRVGIPRITSLALWKRHHTDQQMQGLGLEADSFRHLHNVGDGSTGTKLTLSTTRPLLP